MLNVLAVVAAGVPTFMEAATGDLADLLQSATTIMTSIIAWVTSVISMITSNPLILLFVIMSVALIAIGVVRRLLKL